MEAENLNEEFLPQRTRRFTEGRGRKIRDEERRIRNEEGKKLGIERKILFKNI